MPGEDPGTSVSAAVVARGTHRLAAITTTGAWPDDAGGRNKWTLAYADTALARIYGEPPRIMAATVNGDNDTVTIDTDAGLRPDVEYEISALFDDPTKEAIYGQPVSVTGLRASRPPRDRGEGRLLDIDAPLIRPEGRGGDYQVGPGGDRKLTGGVATVSKAILHQLLRDASPLRWKSMRPADLQTEERRLSRAALAIPYVQTASVSITFPDADAPFVTVTARTDFGDVDAGQAVS